MTMRFDAPIWLGVSIVLAALAVVALAVRARRVRADRARYGYVSLIARWSDLP